MKLASTAIALLLIGCGAVLGAVPAAAAAPAADYTAPYAGSSARPVMTCEAASTCRATAVAERRSGRTSSAADYGRSTTTEGSEKAHGDLSFEVPVQLPKGSSGATVTATWHIDSASASAVSVRGTLRAGALLLADIGCVGGCTTSSVVTQVTLACSEEGVATCMSTPGTDGGRAQAVDLTVTATVSGLARPAFTFWTHALSYVEAGPVCGATPGPTGIPLQEDCSTVVEPLHAGEAHSAMSATLARVHVDAS
jgi:hypothetical protein